MAHNNFKNDDKLDPNDDLAQHGVHDIIPEDEEYYTLDLKRNFDGDGEDELSGFDVSNVDPHNLDQIDEPPNSSSIYEDATLVQAASNYHSNATNHGGNRYGKDLKDHGVATNDRVGDPGHWGVDEDTE